MCTHVENSVGFAQVYHTILLCIVLSNAHHMMGCDVVQQKKIPEIV